MFRDNKKSMIDAIKLLPRGDIPAYLKERSAKLTKMSRKDLQEIADIVIAAMIPPRTYPKYKSFEEDVSFIIQFFGPSAIESRFSALVSIHVNNMLGFIEKHAREIREIYSADKLLTFLADNVGKIFSDFPAFPVEQINNKLTFTFCDSHHDTDDRLVVSGYRDFCQNDRFSSYASIPEKTVNEIARANDVNNFKLMPADELFKLYCRHTGNHRDKNAKIIFTAKQRYDKEAYDIAASNLSKAILLITLFADKFSTARDINAITNLLGKLKIYDDNCRNSVINTSKHDHFSLAHAVLSHMRPALQKQSDLDTVMKFIEPALRLTFMNEQEQFMEALKQDHKPGKLHALFTLRKTADTHQTRHAPALPRRT